MLNVIFGLARLDLWFATLPKIAYMMGLGGLVSFIITRAASSDRVE
jgi:hypothetical protein